ncbi:WD repeat-containing protein [Scheffersomyces amazonensis]|uniref:WD repeat-containing protein n=1 Tax=Scheffersomyces amazonensis TaxID=1078765 RepID=UPI00315C7D6B
MAAISDFEKQRQENIQRNRELLKQLNLDTISQSISNEVPEKRDTKKRRVASKARPVKREPIEPSRRSRRLAGIQSELDNPEEFAKIKQEEDEKERQKQELERLRRTRLLGDFSLMDLVTDKKSGNWVFENKVIKKEDEEEDKIENNQETVTVPLDEDNKALDLLRSLGDKFSAGDFYEELRKVPINNDKDIEIKRKEFDNLKIYERFDPLDIKLAHYRITSINFHPSTTDRVVMAGDTNGNVGIWAVDSNKEADEPLVSILKPHGKSISKILTPVQSPSKIYTSSYDGSVRQLDLNKLESSELAYLNDPIESGDYALGISDINQCRDNPHILYMTTLSGNFYRYDTRTKFKSPGMKDLLRLHDKKIGAFTINPNASYQIATASLDRSLRIWDLRNTSKLNASWSEYENQVSPHLYGKYISRLSVSTVDWNLDNRLVCNGYDDSINLFDFSGSEKNSTPITKWSTKYTVSKSPEIDTADFKPFNKIRHNCQTGRWVSILKARWQYSPQDGVQKFIIANMNRGLDIYDQKGQILAHLSDSVGAVPAVCTLHPTQNWAVGGSASGKIYLFN